MTNDPIPPSQANRLVLLLDALTGVTLSDAERASLIWLAGFERCTVENVAAVITRVHRPHRHRVACRYPLAEAHAPRSL
ncbi:MAG: hypothetical protein ACRDRW_20535, partial [Pseudonocardiaceae bacterium]